MANSILFCANNLCVTAAEAVDVYTGAGHVSTCINVSTNIFPPAWTRINIHKHVYVYIRVCVLSAKLQRFSSTAPTEYGLYDICK